MNHNIRPVGYQGSPKPTFLGCHICIFSAFSWYQTPSGQGGQWLNQFSQGERFEYEKGKDREDHVVPSICHIWYYTTFMSVNSEGNGEFSGARSLVKANP